MSQQLEASAWVPLDTETAFALAHTLGDDRTAWDSEVESRMLIRAHRELGPGAQVFERVGNGRRVIVEVDVWHPGQLSSTKLIKGPWWLAEYGEGWHVRPDEDGSRVTLKLTWRHAAPLFADAASATLRASLREELDRRMADFVVASEDATLVSRVRDRMRSGELAPGARHRERR
ncbi:hypothetical protein EG850_03975 [Gulosibacter macacae]|uniref:SRPBCC family protein n=1 Tax=Gulosibacter macacae TaxID=2488791 RepID=A0A3P3VYU0_9MICO|nr:SRPBCC family protein [Gulosibacter macacae]RRJ87467.1 hypothetical protein EG850_03975 [Gulosibacter macacae]